MELSLSELTSFEQLVILMVSKKMIKEDVIEFVFHALGNFILIFSKEARMSKKKTGCFGSYFDNGKSES